MQNVASEHDQYDMSKAIVLGAVASCVSISFSLILQSILYHQSFNTNTTDQMDRYVQLFFFALVSYFGASIFVWKQSRRLSDRVPLWVAISSLGSLIFCFSFFTFVYLKALFQYTPGDQIIDAPPAYTRVLVSILISTLVLTFITGVPTAIVSWLYSLNEKRTRE